MAALSLTISRAIELAIRAKAASPAAPQRSEGEVWDWPPEPEEVQQLGLLIASLPYNERFMLQVVMHLGRRLVYDNWRPDEEWIRDQYEYMRDHLGDVEGTVRKICSLVNELPRFLERGLQRLAEGGLEVDSLLKFRGLGSPQRCKLRVDSPLSARHVERPGAGYPATWASC